MREIRLDFSPEKSTDELRNIFGINNHVKIGYKPRIPEQQAWFKELSPRFLRHHDAPLENPSKALIDVSRIFPLFHLDENDPKNYYFADTDDYFSVLEDKTVEIDFRLGETIDHSGFGRRIAPPADFEKWARICKNIIAHYKDGAFGGMHLNITHLTILEEPDTYPELFTGTFDDYMGLFAAAYRVLGEAFPDVSIGGHIYGRNEERRDLFLEGCKKYGIVPGHFALTLYFREPDDLVAVVDKYAARLHELGFDETKILITEWHLGPEMWGEAGHYGDNGFKGSLSAAFTSSVLIRLTDIPVLKAAFFYAWGTGIWGVFEEQNGKQVRLPVFFALKFYSDLVRGCTERVDVEWDKDKDKDITVLAGRTASGGKKLLVSCYHAEDASFSIAAEDCTTCTLKAVRTDYCEEACTSGESLTASDGRFVIPHTGGSAVYLVEMEP